MRALVLSEIEKSLKCADANERAPVNFNAFELGDENFQMEGIKTVGGENTTEKDNGNAGRRPHIIENYLRAEDLFNLISVC